MKQTHNVEDVAFVWCTNTRLHMVTHIQDGFVTEYSSM